MQKKLTSLGLMSGTSGDGVDTSIIMTNGINQYELIKAREKRNVFNYKPGITGLAQVTGYDMSDPEALSRIDKIYYNNRTLKLDMQILICTLSGLFRQKLKHLVVDSKNV